MDQQEIEKLQKEMRKNDPRCKKAAQEDIELAYQLLSGVPDGVPSDKNGLLRSRFLSRDTKPTEKEARAALARVLISVDPPRMVLYLVAALFDQKTADMGKLVPRQIHFKNINQGHHDQFRDFAIAKLVEKLRNNGKPYQKATEEAAEELGITPRQVQRIYPKHFPKRARKVLRSAYKTGSDTSSRS